MIWLPFGLALVCSLALVPVARRLAVRFGRVATPRDDRWHRQPTPISGGVAIYASFLISLGVMLAFDGGASFTHWGLLAGSTLMFLLGLYDDFREITPPVKLVGQISAAAMVIVFGYNSNFFTPRIENTVIAQIPNILLTFFWLVAITNAINLLDNMDGLAGGISLIAAGLLAFFFWRAGDEQLFAISAALAGGLLGFLIFNFPPASIFMGDSGSLFLGFTLAILAIARQPQASNVFAVMGVPTLIFLLPILDTTLVTITRLLRGQSPARGGRDHTSHRLIAFGLTERQALFILYLIALASGIVGIALETLDYWLSLVLVPVLVLSLALVAAYLGRIKVVSSAKPAERGTITRLMVELTYKRHLMEVLLDFILIGIVWYLTFWVNEGLALSQAGLEAFLGSLPIVYTGAYLAFIVFGVYRGVWRYVGVDDLLRFGKATAGSVGLAAAVLLLLFPTGMYPLRIFLLYAMFMFLGLAASRSSFKILDQIYGHQSRREEERVLIVGAGDAGEIALRWMLMNPQMGYRPVGFLDDDPYSTGRKIHGIDILGNSAQLDTILREREISGVVVTIDERLSEELMDRVIAICKAEGRWVRSLRLEFELIEGS